MIDNMIRATSPTRPSHRARIELLELVLGGLAAGVGGGDKQCNRQRQEPVQIFHLLALFRLQAEVLNARNRTGQWIVATIFVDGVQ